MLEAVRLFCYPDSNPEISGISCRRFLESKAVRDGTCLLNSGTERLRFEYATLRDVVQATLMGWGTRIRRKTRKRSSFLLGETLKRALSDSCSPPKEHITMRPQK